MRTELQSLCFMAFTKGCHCLSPNPGKCSSWHWTSGNLSQPLKTTHIHVCSWTTCKHHSIVNCNWELILIGHVERKLLKMLWKIWKKACIIRLLIKVLVQLGRQWKEEWAPWGRDSHGSVIETVWMVLRDKPAIRMADAWVWGMSHLFLSIQFQNVLIKIHGSSLHCLSCGRRLSPSSLSQMTTF